MCRRSNETSGAHPGAEHGERDDRNQVKSAVDPADESEGHGEHGGKRKRVKPGDLALDPAAAGGGKAVDPV